MDKGFDFYNGSDHIDEVAAVLYLEIPEEYSIPDSGSITPTSKGKGCFCDYSLAFTVLQAEEEGEDQEKQTQSKLISDYSEYSKHSHREIDIKHENIKGEIESARVKIKESIAQTKQQIDHIATDENHITSYLDFLKNTKTQHVEIETLKKEIEKNEILLQKITEQNYLKYFHQSLDKKSIFAKYYQHHIQDRKASGPSVIRFGINSELFKGLSDVNTFDILHSVEYCSLYSSVDYLKHRQSTTEKAAVYKKNIVLCDIFARKDGIIKTEPDNKMPETHTIALWKITDKKIVLIDPTNANYSLFIAKHFNIGDVEIISVIEEFNLSDKHKKFYNKGEETIKVGLGAKDPRDCIDIGVKIAFELNELQKESIDSKTIIGELYKKMSNYDRSDVVNSLKLMRDAHSSDVHIREAFIKLYELLSKKDLNPLVLKDIFHPKFSGNNK